MADVEQFGTVPLFEHLEPLEIVELLDISETRLARKGDVILSEGNPGDGFYVIGKGTFEVVKNEPERVVLARLGEMSFFGEMSLVSNKPCAASIECVEPGRLRHFPLAAFQERLKQDDLVAYKVVHSMCRILADRLAQLDKSVAAAK